MKIKHLFPTVYDLLRRDKHTRDAKRGAAKNRIARRRRRNEIAKLSRRKNR